MLRVLFAVILLLPLPLYANENNTDTSGTTTTTTTSTTTTTIPGETEEVETFDGPPPTTTTTTIPEETTTTTTTTSTTTTTTIPEWEQATDIVLPEDELDIDGDEIENNIVIDNIWTGKYGCTDFCMNLEYQQHGGDGSNYSFDLPETVTVDEAVSYTHLTLPTIYSV